MSRMGNAATSGGARPEDTDGGDCCRKRLLVRKLSMRVEKGSSSISRWTAAVEEPIDSVGSR